MLILWDTQPLSTSQTMATVSEETRPHTRNVQCMYTYTYVYAHTYTYRYGKQPYSG